MTLHYFPAVTTNHIIIIIDDLDIIGGSFTPCKACHNQRVHTSNISIPCEVYDNESDNYVGIEKRRKEAYTYIIAYEVQKEPFFLLKVFIFSLYKPFWLVKLQYT